MTRRATAAIALAALATACGRLAYDPLASAADGGAADAPVTDAGDAAAPFDGAPFDGGIDAASADGGLADGGGTDGRTIVELGLLAWYELEEPADDSIVPDSSGNERHGSCDGVFGPRYTPIGASSGSYAFEGTDTQLILVSDDPGLHTTTGFTVCAWVLPNEPSRSAIVSKPFGAANNNSWQLEHTLDLLPSFNTGSSAGQSISPATGARLALGTWAHLCGTWDGSIKRLYVNGIEVLAEAAAVEIDSGPIVIGGDLNAGAPGLTLAGQIDEVRIYDRPLSEAAIGALAAL